MVWRRLRSGMIFPAGGGAPTTLTLFDSNTAGGSSVGSITAPASIQSGDLIIHAERSTATASGEATPSGFTTISSINIGSGFQIVSYKIADGTEGGTSISGMDGSVETKIIAVYRPDNPITSVTLSTVNSTISNNNPGGQGIDVSGGTAPIIAFGVYGQGSD